MRDLAYLYCRPAFSKGQRVVADLRERECACEYEREHSLFPAVPIYLGARASSDKRFRSGASWLVFYSPFLLPRPFPQQGRTR